MSTPQQPIPSAFNAASTADEVIQGIDLSGKVAIVTGGYSGLGRETARVLANAGATVIVPTRDLTKARRELAGVERVEIEPMDLLDPASIDAFADRFLASGRPLHILVNSAGIMAHPLKRDVRGYESQFATNHLGHFQLTTRLEPALVRAGGARVVSVSSWGHHFSPVVLDDPNFERRPYNPWASYGQSKTANILFALALDERLKDRGVRAFSCHPGGILDTNLGKHLDIEQFRPLGVIDEQGKPIIDPYRGLKTVQQGAATLVWCAVSPQLEGKGGVYCENCDIAPIDTENTGPVERLVEMSRHRGVMSYAVDPQAAKQLWALSEKLLGAAARAA